jgi:hypothetical protein
MGVEAVIAMMVAALAFMMGYVAYYGRQHRLTGGRFELQSHRGGVSCAMWLMALTIVLLETGLPHPPLGQRSALFWVHLPLAASFLLLFLALRFRYTGLRTRRHRNLAYACLTLFVLALATGSVLLAGK